MSASRVVGAPVLLILLLAGLVSQQAPARAQPAGETAPAQSIVLDDFERAEPSPWRYSGPGELTIVPGVAPGSEGRSVMRLETTVALRDNRIWWGQLQLGVPAVADWSGHHFLTCWVRASGHRRIHALAVYLENDGKRLESHHVILPAGEWTRIVYPVTHLVRDSISTVFFSHTAVGGLPGEALDEVYEFDDLRLEGGPPAPMAGWAVIAGTAAFSHVGHRSPLAYQPVIGDVFGSMYQGIGSRDGDTPFLSPNCHHTQKEIWGVCGGLYLLAVAQAP